VVEPYLGEIRWLISQADRPWHRQHRRIYNSKGSFLFEASSERDAKLAVWAVNNAHNAMEAPGCPYAREFRPGQIGQ